jgi:hypothetical protein
MGGPDLQRAGFWRRPPHKTEGLPRRLPETWICQVVVREILVFRIPEDGSEIELKRRVL